MAVQDKRAVAPVTVRRAGAADAAAIHRLLVALAAETGNAGRMTATVEDIREHGFGPAPAFQALIAEAAGAPCGLCLWFTSFSSWRGKTGVYVQDLYVADAWRGSGLGRRLLAEVAGDAAGQGAAYLRLAVDAANIAGQRFYEKVGLRWREPERLFEVEGAAFEALGAAATRGDDDGSRQ